MAKKNKQSEHGDVRWAWATVASHCSFSSDVESMQNDLWDMLKASVTHKEDYYDASDRSNFIYSYETMVCLLDAMHILHQHRNNGEKPKS